MSRPEFEDIRDKRALVFSAAQRLICELHWSDLVEIMRKAGCDGDQIEHVSGLYHELENTVANCEGGA